MRAGQIIRVVSLVLAGVLLLWTYWVSPQERRLVQAAIDQSDAIDRQAALSGAGSGKGSADFERAVDEARDGEVTFRDKVVFDSLKKYELDVKYQPNAVGVHQADKLILEHLIGHKQS
jgi:hypothetical protein